MTKLGFLAFLFASLLLVILNLKPILSYFSQDDFFHLNAISEKSLIDIPSFFTSLQRDYAFYRPLSRETYNLLMYKTFGLNPLPFHLVNLALILGIGVAVYLLSKKIYGSFLVASIATVVYSISSVHNVEFYYLGSVQNLSAAFFICLSILFYLKQRKVLSLILFFAALTCHESAIVLPGILILFELIFNRKNLRNILPFIVISLIYLFLSSLFTSLPGQDVYKPVFNIKKMLNALGWYLGWNFGLPEILPDFVGPKLSLNPNFLEWYGNYIKLVLPLLIFIFISTVISTLLSWKKYNKQIIFLVGAYIVTISPFLFFPQHKFIYYLTFPTIFFSIILAMVFSSLWDLNKIHRLFLLMTVFSMLIVFKSTNDLNSITYWAAKRATAARFLLKETKKAYSTIPRGTILYFTNDPSYPNISKEWGNSSKQAFYILSGADALQLFYKDHFIKVYFEDIGIPENIDKSKILNVIARFPY